MTGRRIPGPTSAVQPARSNQRGPTSAVQPGQELLLNDGEATTAQVDNERVTGRLSTFDRFLPVWIGATKAAGLALGRIVRNLNRWLNHMEVDTVSLPITIGLVAMRYPAKVRHRSIGTA